MVASDQHANDIDLEAARTGEAPAEVSEHVNTCAVCQERKKLLDDLASTLTLDPIAIPIERDQAILSLARKPRRKKSRARIVAYLTPVAAAAALILVLAQPFVSEGPGKLTEAGPADVNSDGTVNIVDALMLAKAIEGKKEIAARWDINGDESVDQGDVEGIALAAVSLQGSWR